MKKRKTALEYIIEQETQQLKEEIKEKDEEIKEKKEEIEEKDEKLTNLISEIKDYYSKEGQIPKEILSALLKIWKKQNSLTYKIKHLQSSPFFKYILKK